MLPKALACAATATVTLGVCAASVAHADPNDGVAINGTYTAFSDGEWAKTNQSFHDEASVTQTWTVTSTCTTFQDCTGRVTSDQGWSADLVYVSGRWKVSRTLENWEQGRNSPTRPAQTLLRIMELEPQTVQRALRAA